MKTTFIYKLIDPQTGETRYIGKSNNPKRRLSAHYNRARYKPTHKFNWIKTLKDKGIKPVMEIIEEVPTSSWKEREKYWIKHYLDKGCNLTNCTVGGDGLSFGNQTSFKDCNNGKPVLVYDLEGNFIERFCSSRKCRSKYGAGVNAVLRKDRKTNNGFTFIYEKDFDGNIDSHMKWVNERVYKPNSGQFKKGEKSHAAKPVIVEIISSGEMYRFESAKSAAEYLNIKPGLVRWGCATKKLISNKKYKVAYE